MDLRKNNRYFFIKRFGEFLYKNTGLKFTEDLRAYILANVNVTNPHKKIDNKGRYSEYYTFPYENVLLTIVVDGNTKKILTAVIETHRRKNFEKT